MSRGDGSAADNSEAHLLLPREGSQSDVHIYIALLVQSDYHRAETLLPPRRGQVMNQFQGWRLVHGVGGGPVDTDLEGFLLHEEQEGQKEKEAGREGRRADGKDKHQSP